MDIREQVISILSEVKPTNDLRDIKDIFEGGYIDSFELMFLISKLCEVFEIEIGVDEMSAENFNSVDAIAAMVERLK